MLTCLYLILLTPPHPFVRAPCIQCWEIDDGKVIIDLRRHEPTGEVFTLVVHLGSLNAELHIMSHANPDPPGGYTFHVGLPSEMRVCHHCHAAGGGEGGVKLQMCPCGLGLRYCGKECQIKDWKRHKSEHQNSRYESVWRPQVILCSLTIFAPDIQLLHFSPLECSEIITLPRPGAIRWSFKPTMWIGILTHLFYVCRWSLPVSTGAPRTRPWLTTERMRNSWPLFLCLFKLRAQRSLC